MAINYFDLKFVNLTCRAIACNLRRARTNKQINVTYIYNEKRIKLLLLICDIKKIRKNCNKKNKRKAKSNQQTK